MKNKDESPLKGLFYDFDSSNFKAFTKVIPVELTKYVNYNSLLDFQDNKVTIRNISTNSSTFSVNDLETKFEFYENEQALLPIASVLNKNKEGDKFFGHFDLKKDEVNKN